MRMWQGRMIVLETRVHVRFDAGADDSVQEERGGEERDQNKRNAAQEPGNYPTSRAATRLGCDGFGFDHKKKKRASRKFIAFSARSRVARRGPEGRSLGIRNTHRRLGSCAYSASK